MQAFLIEYTQRDSPWHRMDPRWKLAGTLLSCVAVVLLQTLPGAAAALVGVLALLATGKLPWRWYTVRLGSVAVFLALFAILLPLTMPGEDWRLGPVGLSANGANLALLISLRALAIVALTLFLLATTPLETTLHAARALHCPGLAIQLLLLTYRYVYLFSDELSKLRIALRLRGYRNRVSAHSYRTIGHVTGTLLVRSYERAERVSQAMRCRGFDGQFRSLRTFQTGLGDLVKFAGLLALAAGLPWIIEAVWRMTEKGTLF
jgi:cobalt/nickel transport system permease protein